MARTERGSVSKKTLNTFSVTGSHHCYLRVWAVPSRDPRLSPVLLLSGLPWEISSPRDQRRAAITHLDRNLSAPRLFNQEWRRACSPREPLLRGHGCPQQPPLTNRHRRTGASQRPVGRTCVVKTGWKGRGCEHDSPAGRRAFQQPQAERLNCLQHPYCAIA